MTAKLTGNARSDALASLKNWTEVPSRDAIQRSLKFADFNHAWGFMSRVAMAAAQARLEEAEAHYRRIWQFDTNCAPAALGLGKIASARDRSAEAAEFLGKATTDSSTRKAAHRHIGAGNNEGRLVLGDGVENGFAGTLDGDAARPGRRRAHVADQPPGPRALRHLVPGPGGGAGRQCGRPEARVRLGRALLPRRQVLLAAGVGWRAAV